MKDEVLEFIQRRFNKDCNWIDGNCYYFTVILKNRFPEGKIYYDIVWGHFVFKYKNKYYDWTGVLGLDEFLDYLIEWDKFNEYDSLRRERVVRDCIM